MVEHSQGGFLIGKIKQIQGRVFEKLLTEYGIAEFNGAQGRILFVLWDEDNIPISKLSQKTGLAKTTLTSMLDRLETAGHVRRLYDTGDRRRVNIRLTETARGFQEKYTAVSARMNEIFYQDFTDAEIFSFEEKLLKILENLTGKEAEQ